MTAYLRSDSPKVSKEHSLLQFSSNKFEIRRSAEAEASLTLKDLNISRKHCVFLCADDSWTITDYSSSYSKLLAETNKEGANIETAMDRGFNCPTCLDIFIRPVALNCGQT